MHPFEKDPPSPPPGVAPHLELRMKPGWRFDSRKRALVSESGQTISLRNLLPTGARVLLVAPSLADDDKRLLSDDERLLSRSLQVALPADADSKAVVAALRKIKALDQVSTGPQIGLP
jgi:hypothetical protein